MGKASRKKKGSINETLTTQGKQEKELGPSQESTSKGSLQKTTSIIAFIPLLIILLVSFAVYFNALFGDFVYDDTIQIMHNPWIRDTRNIPTIFSKNVWSYDPGLSTSNYYRPLMHVIYMLNYHLFGMKPWGFHLINILFHCGVSVLVFLIIRRFLAEHRATTSSVYLSPPFIAAILFASHPIHTEAVAWIAGLPDLAFTFFYLLSFYLYIDSRGGRSKGYIFSVVCFALAALFKEPALTLPVILFGYDFVFGEARTHPLGYVKKYIPFVIIGSLYMAVRIHALGGFAPQKRYEILSSYQYAINVFPLFMQYLEKLLLPIDLNALYVFHPIASILELKGAISFIGTIVFLIFFYMALRKNRTAFLGLLFVTVPLLPVLYIPALGENVFTERYLYLPSVGFVLLLAIFLSWTRRRLPSAVKAITFISIAIVGLYTVGTVNRNNVWKNSFNLWSDTVKKSPERAEPHVDLGSAYASKGQLDMAIEQYQSALRLKPENAEAHNGLANAYAFKGLLDMAIEQYQSSLRLKPENAEAHINLGNAYKLKGQLDMAVAEYQSSLRLKPENAEAHNNLGNAYASKGLLDMAVAEYQSSLRLKPENAEAHFNLGLIYLNNGSIDLARTEFQLGLKSKPGDYRAQEILNSIISRKQ